VADEQEEQEAYGEGYGQDRMGAGIALWWSPLHFFRPLHTGITQRTRRVDEHDRSWKSATTIDPGRPSGAGSFGVHRSLIE